jgi:hypothetical protein
MEGNIKLNFKGISSECSVTTGQGIAADLDNMIMELLIS